MLILRDYIISAASQINAGGGTNGDNPTNLGVSDFSLVATTLDSNNAYKFLSGIEGEDKFGTGPIRNAYFALCNTNLTGNIDNVAGALNVSQYPSPMNALKSEWAAIGNLRFLISSIGIWLILLKF